MENAFDQRLKEIVIDSGQKKFMKTQWAVTHVKMDLRWHSGSWDV